MKKLGVNIDHIATIRNARGGEHPCPANSLNILKKAGADIVTIHLREDRRHIKDADVLEIREKNILPVNLEIAPTKEMLEIAVKVKPASICIVPEKREEITTEGGFDLINNDISEYMKIFKDKNIKTSIFIEPNKDQIYEARKIGADMVEIHTGKYSNLFNNDQKNLSTKKILGQFDYSSCKEYSNETSTELEKIISAISYANNIGLLCNVGHGLTTENIIPILSISNINEFHIGHYIIGEAIFFGLEKIINNFKTLISSTIK